MYQISLFDGEHKFENDKPIRLIELFGVDYESKINELVEELRQ